MTRTDEYRIIRVSSKTTPESASCDDDSCEWAYEGMNSINEARFHTYETGHDTVVWSTSAAWYSRHDAR